MAKRRHHSGSVRKRSSDSWEISFRINGNRKYETVKVSHRREAEQVLMERLLAARDQQGRPDGVTFKEAAERWFAADRRHLAPKTFELWSSILRCHLYPAFGNDQLGHITPSAIEDYREAKLEGFVIPVEGRARRGPLSNQTVVHHLTVLSRVFDYAVRDGVVSTNPVKLVRKPRLPRTALPNLTASSIKRLIDEMPDDDSKLIVSLMAGLGLRIGEALGVRVSNWNPRTRRLHIDGAVKRANGRPYRAEEGKTRAANRVLPVSERLARELDSRAASAVGELLFPNQRGNPRDPGNFRTRIFKPAAERAGLVGVKPHGLRHFWASESLSAGVPQHIVQAHGGWSSSQSMNVYAHLTEADRDRAADLMEAINGRDNPDG